MRKASRPVSRVTFLIKNGKFSSGKKSKTKNRNAVRRKINKPPTLHSPNSRNSKVTIFKYYRNSALRFPLQGIWYMHPCQNPESSPAWKANETSTSIPVAHTSSTLSRCPVDGKRLGNKEPSTVSLIAYHVLWKPPTKISHWNYKGAILIILIIFLLWN